MRKGGSIKACATTAQSQEGDAISVRPSGCTIAAPNHHDLLYINSYSDVSDSD